MAGTSPQRAWRAACPNCGAPVEFASAASASAVCSFCRSTLLRDGDALRRIGISAELFDDHSPLQLGAAGRYQGLPFTLVGRLQMSYADGTWNEWHALFEGAEGERKSGWLSEDNGAYVFAFDAPVPSDAPADASALAALQAGQRVLADRRAWDVASVVAAQVLAAEGELPSPPKLGITRSIVDLRNSAGEVATLEEGSPSWSVGRSVRLAELAMQGLREGVAEKTLASRAIECPSCGAALTPTLASTKSIACGQCHAVVDISQGAGADLAHYAQNNSGASGVEPQLALGSTGMLALGGPARRWQVVGFLERCELAGGEDDEQTFWREYLLYEREEGFAFLVDAQDGWSWVRPLTAAPQVRGDRATWQGQEYRKRYSYGAMVTWVQGEFYWRVRREERAHVTDYHGVGSGAQRRMSREQVGQEVTWSAGEALNANVIANAFGLAPGQRAPLQRDVPVLATQNYHFGGGSVQRFFLIVFIAIVLMVVISQCSDDRCDDMRETFGASSAEYQQCVRQAGTGSGTRGGSFGGWSGGGGHK